MLLPHRFSSCIKKTFYLPAIISTKERLLSGALLVVFLSSSLYLVSILFSAITEVKPAFGGEYIEGMVGQPRLVNPIYAAASDVDRDLTELLFAGLMAHSPSGQLVPDLASGYEIKEGGRVYEFEIRTNIFWHDGSPITADDIVFTIETIQNQAHQSPLRANWLGVATEKVSDNRVVFTLPRPYAPFLELATVKILPKHIWKDISPENFPLAEQNLQTIVGSGPYRLKEMSLGNRAGKVERITLEANRDYFGSKPFIKTIRFAFFDSERELISAAQTGAIDGLAPTVARNYILNNSREYRFTLLRYFAVFLNADETNILKQKDIREALAYATDKEQIINEVFSGKAAPVSSPLLPEAFGLAEPEISYAFNAESAEKLLDAAGFKINPDTGFLRKITAKASDFKITADLTVEARGKQVEELQKCLAKDPQVYPAGTVSGYFGEQTKEAVIKFQEKYADEILRPAGLQQGNGRVGSLTRQKINAVCFPKTEEITPLKLTLFTGNQSPLPEIAEELKKQWKKIGVELEVQKMDTSDLLNGKIKSRDYELLLFGQVLGAVPDPFPFWHSTQKIDPGLNLTLFESKSADAKLKIARESENAEERKQALEELQNLILQEIPAVFIARPDYLYFVSPKVKGIDGHIISDPSKRFAGISEWYIKTRRILK